MLFYSHQPLPCHKYQVFITVGSLYCIMCYYRNYQTLSQRTDLEFICYVCGLVICVILIYSFCVFMFFICIAVYITVCITVCLAATWCYNK